MVAPVVHVHLGAAPVARPAAAQGRRRPGASSRPPQYPDWPGPRGHVGQAKTDLRIQTVGVAGFEPTASSSGTRIGFGGSPCWTRFLLVAERQSGWLYTVECGSVVWFALLFCYRFLDQLASDDDMVWGRLPSLRGRCYMVREGRDPRVDLVAHAIRCHALRTAGVSG